MIRIFAALVVVMFAGCVSVPLVAKSSKGEKFIGTADASPVTGTFELTSVDGVRCWGTYNQWSESKMLKVKFKASDGREGTAMIARTAGGRSGVGSGKANDGTKFDFLMGDSISQVGMAW